MTVSCKDKGIRKSKFVAIISITINSKSLGLGEKTTSGSYPPAETERCRSIDGKSKNR